MDRANRKRCVTLLRYTVDQLKSSYVQVQIVARNKEDEKIQQIAKMNYQVEEFIYLLDAMNSAYDKFITDKPICNVV